VVVSALARFKSRRNIARARMEVRVGMADRNGEAKTTAIANAAATATTTSTGSFASLRMTAKTSNGNCPKQFPDG